jgi:hypothetical protein
MSYGMGMESANNDAYNWNIVESGVKHKKIKSNQIIIFSGTVEKNIEKFDKKLLMLFKCCSKVSEQHQKYYSNRTL